MAPAGRASHSASDGTCKSLWQKGLPSSYFPPLAGDRVDVDRPVGLTNILTVRRGGVIDVAGDAEAVGRAGGVDNVAIVVPDGVNRSV